MQTLAGIVTRETRVPQTKMTSFRQGVITTVHGQDEQGQQGPPLASRGLWCHSRSHFGNVTTDSVVVLTRSRAGWVRRKRRGSKLLMEEGTAKVASLAVTGSGAPCSELFLVLLSFSPHQTFPEQLLPSDPARQQAGKQGVNGSWREGCTSKEVG